MHRTAHGTNWCAKWNEVAKLCVKDDAVHSMPQTAHWNAIKNNHPHCSLSLSYCQMTTQSLSLALIFNHISCRSFCLFIFLWIESENVYDFAFIYTWWCLDATDGFVPFHFIWNCLRAMLFVLYTCRKCGVVNLRQLQIKLFHLVFFLCLFWSCCCCCCSICTLFYRVHRHSVGKNRNRIEIVVDKWSSIWLMRWKLGGGGGGGLAWQAEAWDSRSGCHGDGVNGVDRMRWNGEGCTAQHNTTHRKMKQPTNLFHAKSLKFIWNSSTLCDVIRKPGKRIVFRSVWCV